MLDLAIKLHSIVLFHPFVDFLDINPFPIKEELLTFVS